MPCCDRCVCCKYDLILNLFDIAVSLLPKQLQSDKARMSLIQMESFYIGKAHISKQSESAYAQYKLLAETIFIVAPVELRCESSVLAGILLNVRIQKENGKGMPRFSCKSKCPDTYCHIASVHSKCNLIWQFCEKFGRVPLHGALCLSAVFRHFLCEIAFFIKQRHTYHRYAQVRCALQNIAGQNPKPARICGNIRIKPYFHGKVRNVPKSRVALKCGKERLSKVTPVIHACHAFSSFLRRFCAFIFRKRQN